MLLDNRDDVPFCLLHPQLSQLRHATAMIRFCPYNSNGRILFPYARQSFTATTINNDYLRTLHHPLLTQ